ncbi:transcription antitermination factor NusB [Microlunatus soli]|uniref:Transcription antitermination protein NusB n=1 Tax=Microlunatus soli TaxID=630515 RepID=A0A1H2AK28_9ACTN|nr:transcription antitermination factor NusB [Microlunatus soli]SDT46229.1 NusB antitermination factor [Microlunatus soli]
MSAQPSRGPDTSGRTRSTRTKARKRALDILFEAELRGRTAIETLAERTADADPPVRDYTAQLVRGVEEHRPELDGRITAHLAAGWSLPRMPRVDRAAIRIAVYEIDHVADVPDAVAVSEAVELVGELSTDESPSYVNGLLGAILTDKLRPTD